MSHKIVIDTNVWIKFARIKNIAPLTERLVQYNLTPYINNYLLSELFEVLIRNGWADTKSATRFTGFIEALCEHSTENAIYRLSPDNEDNFLFDIAIHNNCSFIISDDLKLFDFPLRPVRVVSSNWFLKHFPI